MQNLDSATPLEQTSLIGTWRLVVFDGEEQATGIRKPMFGARPNGRLIFLAEGIMMAVLTAEVRPLPTAGEDRIESFNTSICYSGRYAVENGKFITQVDMSWNEAWVGTSQARSYRVDGSRLHVVSDWAPSPFDPGIVWRGVLEWEREA